MDKSKNIIVPWLPNFCTTLTCFFGFLAVTTATAGHVDKSCIWVYFAAITDFLDGRVARLTGSESSFGAAYDSLADLIAFGLAPALISYHAGLIVWAKLGWSIAFIYAIATVLRLARFDSSEQLPGFFTGMPCPAAALFVVSFVTISNNPEVFVLALHLLLVAIMQVSNVPFKHTKQVQVPKKFKLFLLLGIVALMCLIFIYPAWIIYTLISAYIIYSLAKFFMTKKCN